MLYDDSPNLKYLTGLLRPALCRARNDEQGTASLPLLRAYPQAFTMIFFLLISPLYGQESFDALLDDLSGSPADQTESEVKESPPRQDKNPPLPPTSAELSLLPQEEEKEEKNLITNGVTLQGLDKQTARVYIIDAAIGQPIEFGTLKIFVEHCEQSAGANHNESIAFVKIIEQKPKTPPLTLFSGWMFSTSPGLSALEHPIYDVWVKACKTLDAKK